MEMDGVLTDDDNLRAFAKCGHRRRGHYFCCQAGEDQKLPARWKMADETLAKGKKSTGQIICNPNKWVTLTENIGCMCYIIKI